MRHTASRIILSAAVFFFLLFYTIPSFCDTESYTNKKKLKSAVSHIISAIMEEDVDALMEMSQLSGSFQFDKEQHINDLLKDYFNKTVETREIEVKSMEIKSNTKAKVTVLIHLAAINIIEDSKTEPRSEVWNFVKGKKGPMRGEWILVFE